MIVISDTGPLNYLIQINVVDVLPKLYTQIVVPTAVYRELAHGNSPEAVRRWALQKPSWLDIQQMTALPLGLDDGEQEAISLALHLGADLLLIDERKGRSVAKVQGLIVTGTLGVLEAAAHRGLIDLAQAVAQLRTTNFHASPEILSSLLARFNTAAGI